MSKTITSTSQFKSALDKHCYDLVVKAADKVKTCIEKFIQEFYDDYSPTQYERTWTLLNSVVKTKPKKIPNGYEVEVYIDTSLEYDSTWNGSSWTVGNTMYKANNGGQHGNYFASGHNLWDRAYNETTNGEIIDAFRGFMAEKGISMTIK